MRVVSLFVALFFLVACGNSENTTNTPNFPELVPGPLTPIHDPLIFSEAPNSFWNVSFLDNGQMVGYAETDSSQSSRLFISDPPDYSGFSEITPAAVWGGTYIQQNGRAVYDRDGALYSVLNGVETRLTGAERVTNDEEYWISQDGSYVAYIANETYVQVQQGQNITTIDRNELYVVGIDGTNRARITDGSNNFVFYERYRTDVNRYHPKFTPNNAKIIFVMSDEVSNMPQLYSANLDGSGRVSLNGQLNNGAYVGAQQDEDVEGSFSFIIAPDSSKIVYAVTTPGATINDPSIVSLHSVSPDGSNNINISGAMVTGGSVASGRNTFTAMISPDSSSVIFQASADVANLSELYQTPIGQQNRVKLSQGGNLNSHPIIYSNGSRVLYSTDAIYTVAITGGASTVVNQGVTQQASRLELSPDELKVVYFVNGEIWSAQLNGSATQSISAPVAGQILDYWIDPDSSRIVYHTRLDATSEEALHAVNLDGTGFVTISPDAIQTNRLSTEFFGFRNNKAYFHADQTYWAFYELWEYDFSNQNKTNISQTWPKAVTEDVQSFRAAGDARAMVTEIAAFRENAIIIAQESANTLCSIGIPDYHNVVDMYANTFFKPDGNQFYYTMRNAQGWKAYRADSSDCAVQEIFSELGAGISRMTIAPDGQTLVASNGGLYAVDNNGGNFRTLSSGTVKTINNGAFKISPDSQRVVYWSNEETPTMLEIFSSRLDGTVTGQKINGPLTATMDRNDFYFTPEISPDSNWVVYHAAQENNFLELYRSRIDGTQNEKLSGDLAGGSVYPGNIIPSLKISKDSKYVVFMVSQAGGWKDLYSAEIASVNAQPQKMSINMSQGGWIYSGDRTPYHLSDDSKKVAFMARTSQLAATELYVANLDGSGTIKVNHSLPADTNVVGINLSQEAGKLVYAIQTKNAGLSLHTVSLDGSGYRRLADDYRAFYNTNDYRLLLAHGAVVYRARINGVDGLYGQRLNGSDAPILILEIPEARNIRSIALAPNRDAIHIVGDFRSFGIREAFRIGVY